MVSGRPFRLSRSAQGRGREPAGRHYNQGCIRQAERSQQKLVEGAKVSGSRSFVPMLVATPEHGSWQERQDRL